MLLVCFFDLLGYDIKDYEELFEEKFELLKKINEEAMLNSTGKFRASLEDTVILPKPKQDTLPIWRAVERAFEC